MQKGMTIMEILMIIGLIGAIAAFSVPFYNSFQVRQQIGTEAYNFQQNMRQAQSRAMNGVDNEKHGIHLASDRYYLFRGDSYVPGDSENEEIVLEGGITVSSTMSDFIFSQYIGEPEGVVNDVNITLSNTSGETKIVNLNEVGKVDIE